MSGERWGSSRGPRGRKSDDLLREPVEEADGGMLGDDTEVVYRRRRTAESVQEWVERNQLLVLGLALIGSALLIGGWWVGLIPDMIDAVPSWVWSAGWYILWGGFFASIPAYLVLKHVDSPQGHEILDLNPVTNDHRHVRIGRELWDDFEIESPWSDDVSKADLQECTVNGRSGFEVMDLRVPDHGPPTAVVPWLGEASASQIRTYRYAFVAAHRRLSKQANKAMAQEAARSEIIREAAERVVTEMIRDAERSGVPNGEEIEGAVDDVLDDLGVHDSLRDDDLADIDEWEPRDGTREQPEPDRDQDRQRNGHEAEANLPEVPST